MSKDDLYYALLQLPIFQGLGFRDITEIVNDVKTEFLTIPAGKTFIQEDTPCRRIIFILDGEYSVTHFTSNRRIYFVETPRPPEVVGVYTLFGLRQYYTHTYKAITNIQLMTIEKQYVIKSLLHYEICRFNFLNLLSTAFHRSQLSQWEMPHDNQTKRFIQILKKNSIVPSGEKHLYGSMVDLAEYLSSTRLNLSKMLNDLQNKQLIKLERKHFIIFALQDLIRYGQEIPETKVNI